MTWLEMALEDRYKCVRATLSLHEVRSIHGTDLNFTLTTFLLFGQAVAEQQVCLPRLWQLDSEV